MTTGYPLLDAILQGLMAPLPGLVLVLLVFTGPIFIIGLIANRRRKRYKAEAKEPFTDQPLRPPGESLRLRIDEISAEFDEVLLTIMFTGMTAMLMTLLAPASLRLPMGVTAVGTACLVYVRCSRKLFTAQRNLWNHRLGFAGERVVGEALNQLLIHEFKVFHDLPFDGFNIDHVIVGPSGVYAIETKTRRKLAGFKSSEKALVIHRGHTLEYPGKKFTEHGITQAKRNAETLSKWLTNATGETTCVSPILVLPGWFVESDGRGPVKVLNEKQLDYFLSNPRRLLAADRIQRIAYQLTERCRLPKAP